MKINLYYILVLVSTISFSQTLLKGKITNEVDHDGIHVFNKTQSKYTISDKDGDFNIIAKPSDTIVFSAIQYELRELIVSTKTLRNQPFCVILDAKINKLDVVHIKPNLSGNLLSDTKNIRTTTMVTAKTLGLPNADVIPPTPAERRLYTATHSGNIMSVSAIINAITGRTKRLKKSVKLERKTILEEDVYANFEAIIHSEFNIPEDKIYDFIFYSSQDELFKQIIKTNSRMVIYDFLQTKSVSYLKKNKLKKRK